MNLFAMTVQATSGGRSGETFFQAVEAPDAATAKRLARQRVRKITGGNVSVLSCNQSPLRQ
jgi:hypothetical protein